MLLLMRLSNMLKKRLRRHKRRLKNHRQGSEEPDVLAAPMSIYPAAGFDNSSEDETEDTDEDAALPVIAELSYEIELLSVDQAVMKLELSDQTCLMFRNAAHEGLNMVYRRDDNTIGWVDPRGSRQTMGLS